MSEKDLKVNGLASDKSESITEDEVNLTLFANLFLNALLALLSFVIPKSSSLILFGSRKGDAFSGNPKPMFLRLLALDSEFRPLWITRNDSLYRELRILDYPVVPCYSLGGFWSILRARTLVIDISSKDVSYEKPLFGRFHKIQTWHGTPLKKIELDHKQPQGLAQRVFLLALRKELASYDMIVSSSETVSQSLRSGFGNTNVVELGYPRNDIFFDLSLSEKRYDELLGLAEFKRVIVYAPTYRDRMHAVRPFSEKMLDELNAYFAEKNYLFLIKNHYFYSDNLGITKDYSHIRNVSSLISDIQELLIHTDLLVTDYSSVVFDYALRNKPVLFYCYDYQRYVEDCREMYYDYFEDFPGPFLRDERALLEALQTVDEWFLEPSYQQSFQEFVERFNKYRTGGATERVLSRMLGGPSS